MSGAVTEVYLHSIIAKVAKSCYLSDWCYSVKSFEAKAQNYFGELIPVSLQGKTECGEVNFDLVLKLAPTDERFRVSGALTQFFSREIFVYANIIDKYNELRNGLSSCDFVIPKCYYLQSEYCKEAIVLQDMRVQGYRPYLDEYLDLDHIKESLKSLAQFHALSFVFKSNNAAKFKEFDEVCLPLTEKNNKRFFDILLDRLNKALKQFESTNYEPLFHHLISNYKSYVELISQDSVNAKCLCHRDIWKENIMFKYENNIPTSACIIDYQTAQVCSPAFDVLYLITSSTTADLRQHYFHQLLDLYYKRFSEILNEAGLDENVVYSRQMLDEDLATVSPAVLVIVNTAMWLSSGLQQEGHVRSKIIFQTEDEKVKAFSRYKSVLMGIVNDFQEYGYLKY